MSRIHLLDQNNPSVQWWSEHLTVNYGFIMERTEFGIRFTTPDRRHTFMVTTFEELDVAYHAIVAYCNLLASLCPM